MKQFRDLVAAIRGSEVRVNYLLDRLASAKENLGDWLKVLNEEGFFAPSRNPIPVVAEGTTSVSFPYWRVLGFLENVCRHNADEEDFETTELLKTIILEIARFKTPEGTRIDNFQTDTYLTSCIALLPSYARSDDLIDSVVTFINGRYPSTPLANAVVKVLIPSLIANEERDHAVRVVRAAFGYRRLDGGGISGLIEDYYLNELAKPSSIDALIRLCGVNLVNELLYWTRRIVLEDPIEFSIATIASIEDSEQLGDYYRYDVALMRMIRNLCDVADPSQLKPILEDLLAESHPIHVRMAIHLLDVHYASQQELFWAHAERLFKNHGRLTLRHELYRLFKNHAQSFSDAEVAHIADWIEEYDYYRAPGETAVDLRARQVAYQKLRWYSALSEVQSLQTRITALKQVCDLDVDHPDYDIYVSPLFVGSPSPLSADELSQKSLEDLVRYLQVFEEPDEIRGPTREGLQRSLTAFVEASASRICNQLDLFLTVDTQYIYGVLLGLGFAAKKKDPLNWESIARFCERLFDKRTFWEEPHEEGYDFRQWVLGEIASLASELINSNLTDVTSELTARFENLLLIILKRAGQDHWPSSDVLTLTINSPYGRALLASFDLLVHPRASTPLVSLSTLEQYVVETLTGKVETRPEFYSVIGQYYPRLIERHHIILTHLDRCISTLEGTQLEAFLAGYLFFLGGFDRKSYNRLKQLGVVGRAID